MKQIKEFIIIAVLVLGATSHVEAKDPSMKKSRETMGLSFTPNTSSKGKKYDGYALDFTGFQTDILPPEGFVAGASMAITKGDGQVVNRTKKVGEKILMAMFEPLQVCVTDSKGKPAKNVRVLFQVDEENDVPGQANQITASGKSIVYVMTDKHGMATLSLMWNLPNAKTPIDDIMKRDKSTCCYYEDGPFSIIATHGDTKVVFHLKVGGA